MWVYVITAMSGFCGEDTQIVSIWYNAKDAHAEANRIAPDYYGVEVKAYEVQSKET